MLGKTVEYGIKFCIACGGQYLGNLMWEASKYGYGYLIDQYYRWRIKRGYDTEDVSNLPMAA